MKKILHTVEWAYLIVYTNHLAFLNIFFPTDHSNSSPNHNRIINKITE